MGSPVKSPWSATVVAHVCSSFGRARGGGPVQLVPAQLLLAQTDSVGSWQARQALPQVPAGGQREGHQHQPQ